MPRKKKTTITTYEVFIRTPKGENPIITTTDRDKAFRKYRENLGICRLRIDGEELKILEADKLTDGYKLTSVRRFNYPQKAKKRIKHTNFNPPSNGRAYHLTLCRARNARPPFDRAAAGAARPSRKPPPPAEGQGKTAKGEEKCA